MSSTEQTTPVVSSQSPSAAWLDDPTVYAVNREAAHSDHHSSNPQQSLNGTWAVRTAWASEIDVTTAEFAAPALDESDYQSIPAPATLRCGCTILRHYNNIEKGNIVRALARFNGSLGSNKYPNAVLGAWRNRWQWG